MSQEPEKLLEARQRANRQLYQQRIVDQTEAQLEQQQSTFYTGFDASNGLGKLRDTQGNISYGEAITNGAIRKGESVRFRNGGIPSMDAMPSQKQSLANPVKSSPEVKFMLWSLIKFTEQSNPNYLSAGVNLFLNKSFAHPLASDRKKYYSESDILPELRGFKLVFIYAINRTLSNEEKRRLIAFRNSGGIVFAEGDASSYYTPEKKQYVDELMKALNSPLRMTASSLTFGAGEIVPATFPDITSLRNFTTSDVIGGTVISSISNGNGQLIPWISYDKSSRTILSGDADIFSSFAYLYSPIVNNLFAKSLLKIKWENLSNE